MKHIWECRRTGMSLVALMILGLALFTGKADTSTAIASVAIGLGAANAYEKKEGTKKAEPRAQGRKK